MAKQLKMQRLLALSLVALVLPAQNIIQMSTGGNGTPFVPPGTFSFVQVSPLCDSTTGATSVICTMTSNITAGNLLIAACTGTVSFSGVAGSTDTYVNAPVKAGANLAYVLSSVGGYQAVTMTYGSSSRAACKILEFSVSGGAATLDTIYGATGATSPSTITMTPAVKGELFVANSATTNAGNGVAGTYAWSGTGQAGTDLSMGALGGLYPLGLGYAINTNAGTQVASWTFTGNSWGVIGITFAIQNTSTISVVQKTNGTGTANWKLTGNITTTAGNCLLVIGTSVTGANATWTVSDLAGDTFIGLSQTTGPRLSVWYAKNIKGMANNNVWAYENSTGVASLDVVEIAGCSVAFPLDASSVKSSTIATTTTPTSASFSTAYRNEMVFFFVYGATGTVTVGTIGSQTANLITPCFSGIACSGSTSGGGQWYVFPTLQAGITSTLTFGASGNAGYSSFGLRQ